MMLMGLVTNQQKILVRGELVPQETKYPGCHCIRNPESGTTSTLMHRMTTCPHFTKTEQVGKAREILQGKDKSLTKTELLRQLTRLAI